MSKDLTKLSFEIACGLIPVLTGGLKDMEDSQTLVAILYAMTNFNACTLWSGEDIVASSGDIQVQVLGHDCFTSISTDIKRGDHLIGVLKFYKLPQYSITQDERILVEGLGKFISAQLTFNSMDYYASLSSKAELRALQAQINPHFLFNALNTISSMCRTEPLKARDLLIQLSNYLRGTIETSPDLIDIHKEINTVSCYLDIEKARFGDKFDVIVDIPHDLHMKIPPLILQPLVENAVKHAFTDKGKGIIEIKARKHERFYEVKVSDNGSGMDESLIESLLKGYHGDKKIGVYNVDQRLKEVYGPDNGLILDSKPGQGTEAIIRVPIRGRTKRDAIKSHYSR